MTSLKFETFWSLETRRVGRLYHKEISDFDHEMTEVFDKDNDNEKQNIRIRFGYGNSKILLP